MNSRNPHFKTRAFWIAFAAVLLTLVYFGYDAPRTSVGNGYARDERYVFFKGERIDQAGQHDIEKFARAVGHPLTLCKDVDAPSFVSMSEEYSKDKNKVYFKWISPGRFWVVELAGADPATFAVLDSGLAKDAKTVWKADRIIGGADPATATVINPHWTWKDRNRVYYQGSVITGADPATFKHIGQGFYRDAKQVWWCTDPLPGADPDSFRSLGEESSYAADRNHVWSGKNVLDRVDAKSFELVHDHVYKDAARVFVGTVAKEVLGADAASFVKVATLDAGPYALLKDRLRYYLYDPSYSDVYALEQKGDALLISKPVWRSRPGVLERTHGATISARLQNGVLSEPEMVMEPEFKDEKPSAAAAGILWQLKPAFIEAQKRMTK